MSRRTRGNTSRRIRTATPSVLPGSTRSVEQEDYWVAASVQANAASGVQTHIIFGRNEPGLHHYHNAHRRGLNRPLLELERA